ncbi:response regulator [Aliikangiella coralliicola]|uniref:histidine kinase n=1 Tax=Aliikangiella coralliicola TaxID=2592383 RepID=A0A545TS04_9GAMM|nr:response regulator [Aliikangiella coralliicola]TQV80004.1 response regulator [Aliikangiella coralliicola]
MTNFVTQGSEQKRPNRLKLNAINSIAFTAVAFLIFAYASGVLSENTLAEFNRIYADFIFLSVIIISIALKFRKPALVVDPIYWLLLGAAFFSWFGVSILRIALWQELSNTVKDMITNLGYFLYFALSIAAIEVKSYRSDRQLRELPSLIIWGSTLSFVLGAFIFLVLTQSKGAAVTANHFHYTFVFYLLMDLYLCARWLYLSWVCRNSHWHAYFLLGLAAFNWGVADFVEGLSYTNYLDGTWNLSPANWSDWLWYTPYILIYVALQMKVTSSDNQNAVPNFTRSHLLNSPIFFTIICLTLEKLINNHSHLFTSLNSTQTLAFNLWIATCLLFAIIQLLLLGKQARKSRAQLLEANNSRKVLQQRMEQQAQSLIDQAASNQTILETTHNAIFTLARDGKILSCNPAACELIGYSQETLINAVFIEVTQAEGELSRFFTYQSYRQKLSSTTGGVEIESLIVNASGEKIPVHVTLSQETKSNQGFLVVSLVNISAQKQAEQEAHHLKDQFTANISHEFRTPLTIINGVLENLLNHENYQDDKEQIETAKRNVLRMIRMVEQLLELSRIANDPITLSPLNISPVINFVCTSFDEIAKNQQLEFNYRLPKEAWVIGNPQALEKILFNLLSNAFKYTERGKVQIDLQLSAENFKLTVTDTGVGIDGPQQAAVFERFHRVESQTVKQRHGVGIGLALVKELCNAMRWNIEVESKLNQGTQFTVTIAQALSSQVDAHHRSIDEFVSLSESTQQSMAAESFEAQTSRQHQPLKKSKNSVLVVEDNPDMLSHINEILSPHHHCLLADNGEEGIRLAIDYLPDIIISDIMMPSVDGYELLKTLKKTNMTSHIPIILLTALSDSDSKIKGLEAEADDYLSKPFDGKELRLRVNNQLKSRLKLQQKLSAQWQQHNHELLPANLIEDKFVQKLEQVFEKNYRNCDFSILDLAHELAMSDRQVQRKIKALIGISPLETLKQFRLRKAKPLLESGDQIGVVAQSCGFTSQSYFGRCFKEVYGMTPKQFQKSG